ncbi:MAG: helix-turn-helix domain-containing protein [Pseudomonadota bacterium]
MSKKQTTDEKQIALELTIGQRLREAREAANLCIEDVAVQLRLTEPVIEMLEQDEYKLSELLPYVRGYVRNYARLVNVPAIEVDHAFEHLGWAIPRNEYAPLTFDTHQLSAEDKPIRWMTYAVVGILIVLVLSWRALHHESDTELLNTTTAVVQSNTIPDQMTTVSTPDQTIPAATTVQTNQLPPKPTTGVHSGQ